MFPFRPPKTREARFDRDAGVASDGFAAPSFPLAYREVEPSGQPSTIGGFTDTTAKTAKLDRSQFQVRLHVPDLTYTKLFHNDRAGRDKVATKSSVGSGRSTGGGAGDMREKRFTDKYPFKLPDEYEDFQDGGDSVVEFAKRRFKQWFHKQMRTTPQSTEVNSVTPATASVGKKVHIQL